MARNVKLKFTASVPKVKGAKNVLPKAIKLLEQTNRAALRQFKPLTSKFNHPNRPVWRQVIRSGIISFHGGLIIGGTRQTGRVRGGPALYGEVSTDNDKIFYYLDVGFNRHRAMLASYRSLTRAGAGLKTFRRRGKPGALYPFPIAYTPGRGFAADAARRIEPSFVKGALKIFGEDAVVNFFSVSQVEK